MSIILNIDTALDHASVCLAEDERPLALAANDEPKDHASWLQPAIAGLLKEAGLTFNQLDAIAVSIGPGSYTGLRVGLATAKGFCYTLQLPLITVGTLEMLAFAVKDMEGDLICPMIDARRMEVFTALYDKKLVEKKAPAAIILNESSFDELLSINKIIFCGNGSKKLQDILISGTNNAFFYDIKADAAHLAHMASQRFYQKTFSQLAYTEPLYVKAHYLPPLK